MSAAAHGHWSRIVHGLLERAGNCGPDLLDMASWGVGSGPQRDPNPGLAPEMGRRS
ncbi:MAG TPA: hypothetical protein VES02_03530 [Dermatophilaceae bacterium]|nr:hypothetical protein [Dermatophilaceae bacterium]